jgi:hypothetical protein
MSKPELPIPPSRAVPAETARMRGVPNDSDAHLGSVSALAAQHNHVGADQSPPDPVLEQLRSRKIARKGLNVHIYTAVGDAFMAFVEDYDLPKGDTVSMAMQEFLERRGRTIPGVPRITPLPTPTGD